MADFKSPFKQVPPRLDNTLGYLTIVVHYFSPILLILFYLAAFLLRGIWLAPSTQDEAAASNGSTGQMYGPGGKPLPMRKLTGLKRKQDKASDFSKGKKRLFRCVSLLATLSFLASSISVCAHVYLDRGWWCGEPQVVSFVLDPRHRRVTHYNRRYTLLAHFSCTLYGPCLYWIHNLHQMELSFIAGV
jgi:hypothetical protein